MKLHVTEKVGRMATSEVRITVYRWAGAWGPFSVNIPCGECALTMDIIADTLRHELADVPVTLDARDWLSEWWRPLKVGGWHAPIVLVDGKLVSQGNALNRGVLTQAVIEAYTRKSALTGNHVYGKASCPHCQRAKQYLEAAGIGFTYHDVVREPQALYAMLARVKPLVGARTPVTVPQIWIEGHYIGGADALSTLLNHAVQPRLDRGQCSLSPGDGLAGSGSV